jgi:hypothetical protein
MPPVVEDIDRGYRALVGRVRKMVRGPSVTIGIQGTEANEKRKLGETNVGIMLVHEFGSRDGTIPQRSTLRATADRERALFERKLALAAKRAAVQGDIARELGRVGELGVAKVKQTFDQSIGLKPLKPATELRKRSTKPLIDEAILKNSLTWKVRDT